MASHYRFVCVLFILCVLLTKTWAQESFVLKEVELKNVLFLEVDSISAAKILNEYGLDRKKFAVGTEIFSNDTIIYSIVDTIDIGDNYTIDDLGGDTMFYKVNLDYSVILNKRPFSNIRSFKEHVSLNSCIFLNGFDSNNTSFDSGLSIMDAVVHGKIDFSGSRIFSFFNFSNTNVFGSAEFDDCLFEGRSIFSGCVINSNVTYDNSTFFGDLYLDEADIDGYCNFNNAYFKKALYLNYANFTKEVSFRNTMLPTKVSLIKANFKYPIDFTYVNQDKAVPVLAEKHPGWISRGWSHEVQFVKIDTSEKIIVNCYGIGNQSILMDYSYFTVDTVYENKDKIAAQYEVLLNGFKNQGFTDSYRKCDIEYQYFKAYVQGDWFDRLAYQVKKYWWWFGYRKWLILVWTLGVLSVFTMINYCKLDHLLRRVYGIHKITKEHVNAKRQNYSLAWKHWKRLRLSFYYTVLIFFGLRMTHDNFTYYKLRWTLYIYFVFTSGLVCLGFLANWIITG